MTHEEQCKTTVDVIFIWHIKPWLLVNNPGVIPVCTGAGSPHLHCSYSGPGQFVVISLMVSLTPTSPEEAPTQTRNSFDRILIDLEFSFFPFENVCSKVFKVRIYKLSKLIVYNLAPALINCQTQLFARAINLWDRNNKESIFLLLPDSSVLNINRRCKHPQCDGEWAMQTIADHCQQADDHKSWVWGK